MAEDHLAAPSPLPEHHKLAVFAGEWSGEETVFPVALDRGRARDLSRQRAHRSQRLLPDPGHAPDARRQGKLRHPRRVHLRPRGPDLQIVLARLRSATTRPSPASGGWAGKSLILVRGSLRGNARHVYEIIDDNTYNLKIQFSPDAEGWNDVLTGVYRRVH